MESTQQPTNYTYGVRIAVLYVLKFRQILSLSFKIALLALLSMKQSWRMAEWIIENLYITITDEA